MKMSDKTQELKWALCELLPFDVTVAVEDGSGNVACGTLKAINTAVDYDSWVVSYEDSDGIMHDAGIENVKPVLRRVSAMSDDDVLLFKEHSHIFNMHLLLNAGHYDYMKLIDAGLALDEDDVKKS